MPNFDGGHYFLTVLAPVRSGGLMGDDGRPRSHVHRLRETLAYLPTAEQMARESEDGKPIPNSPFARNNRTHLARLVVIDDVPFNGRVGHDAIGVALKFWPDPGTPQKVDRLKNAYLLFSADFDAADDPDHGLTAYLTSLWSTMQSELRGIFENCIGFDSIKSADDFCRYIKRCQIETTMPFNWYWVDQPSLPDLNIKPMALAVLLPLVGFVLTILIWLIGYGGPWTLAWVALFAAGIALGLWFAYARLRAAAAKPFPTAPNSDLASVLKGLYLQQHFVEFAIANQGADPKTLYERFGAFIERHKPQDNTGPTQPPGVLGVSSALGDQ